jgi:hypothetical protein
MRRRGGRGGSVRRAGVPAKEATEGARVNFESLWRTTACSACRFPPSSPAGAVTLESLTIDHDVGLFWFKAVPFEGLFWVSFDANAYRSEGGEFAYLETSSSDPRCEFSLV